MKLPDVVWVHQSFESNLIIGECEPYNKRGKIYGDILLFENEINDFMPPPPEILSKLYPAVAGQIKVTVNQDGTKTIDRMYLQHVALVTSNVDASIPPLGKYFK